MVYSFGSCLVDLFPTSLATRQQNRCVGDTVLTELTPKVILSPGQKE